MRSVITFSTRITMCNATGTQATIIFSTIPKSKNVSEHTTVTFECSTAENGLNLFTLTTTPPATVASSSSLLNGVKKLTLTITDTNGHKSILVNCIAKRNEEHNQSIAFLKIQGTHSHYSLHLSEIQSSNAGLLSAVGNLNSSEITNSTLHITWTAPYTLQGVPINYYTINISDGAVVWSDTTNTTEYLYSVSNSQLLGETLEVMVAAVNDVGTGMAASITIPPGESGDEAIPPSAPSK